MTPIEQLTQIVPALTGVVDRIWYGQLDSPTPCATFTVHDLLDHILVGGGTFAPSRPLTPIRSSASLRSAAERCER
jgi:hypothetical protein